MTVSVKAGVSLILLRSSRECFFVPAKKNVEIDGSSKLNDYISLDGGTGFLYSK